MKAILPWCVALVLAVGLVVLYTGTKSKEKELAALRQANQELSSARAENDELKKIQVQVQELTRLRKENEELHRLRNEVHQLRDEKRQVSKTGQAAQSSGAPAKTDTTAQAQAQLQQLLAENQRLRAENQQFQQVQANVQVNACLNNLRQIDSAKQQWALETRQATNATPVQSDIDPYLGRSGNASNVVCPAGGLTADFGSSYNINSISTAPTCKIVSSTHVLQ